jgi:peptide/nickel transport system permease protein
MQVGGLMGGSMLTETVFAIPGLGRYYIEALYQRDFPVVQGMVLFTAVVFVLANLIVDLSYAFIDPRIRYDSEGD